MKILFEDKKTDQISRFYQKAFYLDFVEKNFFYAGGVGNLETKLLTEVLPACDAGEQVYVFMDLPPGNLEVRKIYVQLSSLIRKCNYSVLIIPMVCAECNLIRTLVQLQVISLNSNIKICTEVGFFKSSTLYESELERKRFNNFEKYCKLVLHKSVPDCMKHTKGDPGNINEAYDMFYTEDCLCRLAIKEECKTLQLKDKVLALLEQYPFNLSEGLKYECGIRSAVAEDVHRKLIDDYNAFTNRLKSLDKEEAFKYKEVQYMI